MEGKLTVRTKARTRAGARVGLLSVVLLLALTMTAEGCSSGGVSTGHAIKGDGPVPGGTVGFPHAKQGAVYRFSFPLLNNTSKDPLEVTSWKVTSIPAGVKVLGYAVYSTDDTPGYLLNGYDATYSKYPDYAGKPITIAPGKTSDFYPNIRVRVVGKITDHIHDCQIEYTQKGHKHKQVLPCDYALEGT